MQACLSGRSDGGLQPGRKQRRRSVDIPVSLLLRGQLLLCDRSQECLQSYLHARAGDMLWHSARLACN